MDVNQWMLEKINARKENGTFRVLSTSKNGIDFWSNDYLGYAREPIVFPTHLGGATGSRLISGNSDAHERLEIELSRLFASESALVFNSGYDANLGLLSAVPQKKDIILYDEDIHASMRDGIRLSHAKAYSFKHNSLADLKKKLAFVDAIEGTIFICIESLYSMRGDMAPIGKMVQLANDFHAELIVDEAHAVGVFGAKGAGICEALDLQDAIFARVVTFGKAYGLHGAAILGSTTLKTYLVNFCRSLIYTTALPSHAMEQILAHTNRLDFEDKRSQLFDNIAYFRSLLLENNIVSKSELNSPIQMIAVGNIEETNAVAQKLQTNGFLVKAVFAPTVKLGNEAIRICLHAFDEKNDLKRLVSLLK